ncbi:MAG: hypothetical protein LBP40_04385 [Campylobacteraceae bacterium]|nr:hypothetical protein [Campylobacteraceae bacterium]
MSRQANRFVCLGHFINSCGDLQCADKANKSCEKSCAKYPLRRRKIPKKIDVKNF